MQHGMLSQKIGAFAFPLECALIPKRVRRRDNEGLATFTSGHAPEGDDLIAIWERPSS
jgi:hypothetical protein